MNNFVSKESLAYQSLPRLESMETKISTHPPTSLSVKLNLSMKIN